METGLTLRKAEENRLATLKNSPEEYLKALCPVKIEDVFASTEPAIAQVKSRLGLIGARAVISYLIAEMLEFFNVTETMSDTQVAITVDLIIEEYPYLKTDDFKLCFKNAMKMKYGQVYNRIDGQIILGWLKVYNSERCLLAQTESENESKTRKLEEKSVTYEQYFDAIREMAADGDKDAMEAMKNSFSIKKLMTKDKTARIKKQLEEFYRKRDEDNNLLGNERLEPHPAHTGKIPSAPIHDNQRADRSGG